MADTAGEADIRGLNIDKVSKDMFEEALIFKKEVKVESTPSREIRWYQKTSGYLTANNVATKIAPIAYGARPFVLEQSWTRNTSYVKKYMLDSPWINMEDESDSDVQVFMNNAEDITGAVANDLDGDIWNVVSEDQTPSNINDVTATAAWDAASGQNPYEDIAEAEQLIREQTKRSPRNLVIYVSAKGYKDLKVWLVTTKGSSIPGFSSQLVENGTLLVFDGKRVVVSENVTADYAMVADLERAAIYKEFKGLTTVFITEQGIGRKIRCWTHGITLLVRPKYVALISNTET